MGSPTKSGEYVDHTGWFLEDGEADLPWVAIPPVDRRIPVKDMVVTPKHYARYSIEPIHFIVENNLDFQRGNAVKYILRMDAKNGEEDLDKALRYLEMYRQRVYRKNPHWWTADGKARPDGTTQA